MSRKKAPEHVNHERWLVSYADFITLLFAFFVVMYSSSQVDNKKIARVSVAIQGGFQQLGVFSGSAPGPPQRSGAGGAYVAPPPASRPNLVGVAGPCERPPEVPNPSDIDVAQLRRELEQALGEELKSHEIEMRVGPSGLVISLREIGFFNSGEAALLPGGSSAIGRIASVLGDRGLEIRVEGHTDNMPIHNSHFRSNWELSTARATEVVQYLVENYGFDPRYVSAAGYSEYRPISSNDTVEGRSKNRRIDVVIVAQHPRPPYKEAAVIATGSDQRGSGRN